MANLFQMPKIRMECIDPERNHYKFYEIETEPALFYPKITKRWGRIGYKPKSLTKEMDYFSSLKKEVENTIKLRYIHGYKLLELHLSQNY